MALQRSLNTSLLHVKVSGTGPNLVLLHGWAMHSGIWRNVCGKLAQNYRLHQVDLPGHGLSSAGKVKTFAQMVAAVAEILPENCILCGWSLGGQIAIELAVQKSVPIRKLVLIATTPCFVRRIDWPWGMDTTMLRLFVDNLTQNYKATINRFLSLQLSSGNDSRAILTQLRHSFFQYAKVESSTLRAGLEILQSIDLREKITKITQPTLLLHGENDAITHAAAAKWMHQLLPDSKLIMFSNCGHAPFLSYPDQFIANLNEL